MSEGARKLCRAQQQRRIAPAGQQFMFGRGLVATIPPTKKPPRGGFGRFGASWSFGKYADRADLSTAFPHPRKIW
jgi:hypothetical protein